MPYHDFLGVFTKLTVRRFGPPGAFLAIPTHDEQGNTPVVLLPNAEVPKGLKVGDVLNVFMYLDSEDRPVATLRDPKIALGEVAFVEVMDTTPIGAFVDWGLLKHLLVPFAEQTRDVKKGERHPVGLFLDKSGRLAGTMRVSEMLKSIGEFTLDERVEGEAWRNEPELGVFVILEKRFVGLLPKHEMHSLERGSVGTFRIAHIHPDGKVELSMRGQASDELANDAGTILKRLSAPNAPALGDKSSPEDIFSAYGLSKKAYKRAVGTLLKQGLVTISGGIVKKNEKK